MISGGASHGFKVLENHIRDPATEIESRSIPIAKRIVDFRSVGRFLFKVIIFSIVTWFLGFFVFYLLFINIVLGLF